VSAYAVLEQQDRVVLLRAAMQQLPDTLRTAVMLRDIRELTYQEIADQLHLPEGTVKSRINRGRTELARQIQLLRVEFERPRNPPEGWRGDESGHRAESHE
jgi:RNA polymerase sigma-70 factor (ECF subfamily)